MPMDSIVRPAMVAAPRGMAASGGGFIVETGFVSVVSPNEHFWETFDT